ncbi:MAG: MATE family efflux transporter [Saprospiraceae bacterium]|nr:MATE family efflux transporter [Saprospiraceae bacterium]
MSKLKKARKLFWEAIKGTDKNVTTGSINRALFILSIPMILEMVMESLFSVIDILFVSRIGVEAVASVGLTESVITLVYAISIGMSIGATAVVARRIGENKPEEASIASMQAIFIGIVISIIVGILGMIYASDILRLMGGSEVVVREGAIYTRIVMGSNIVIMLLFLLNGIFRGAGDAALAMRSLWLANGINIILDPILIFGLGPFPELGLKGAAIATAIGRGVGVVYQFGLLIRGRSIVVLARRHLTFQWEIIQRLIKVSANGAFQFMISSASWIALMRIIALFGDEAVAGYVIAIRLIIFTILPSWGLSNATATLVGQNLGAGFPDRAEKSVWRAGLINTIFMVSVSVVYITFAPHIIAFFDNTPQVIESGVITLRIICLGYLFYAYGMVLSQAFNGAGDTRTPMIINFVCFWLLEIPLGYFLAVPLGWELAGVCWAIAISETALAIISAILFKKGKWKEVLI